nr:cytochrome oxidase putative small subunit CydP [uncultured Pseudomonas sp.]
MTDNAPKSPWRTPLVREIGAIVLIKLVILFSIKAIWFPAPTVPEHGTERFAGHLLGTLAPPPSSLATEEKPR